jgi:ABC-type phosphate/phosphonate transport system substrate-binding protein
MISRQARWALGLVLAATATMSQALTFAVNDGATYKASDAEIRTKYAGIAADLSKILKQPVNIEPVSTYQSLRKGLVEKQYDLAMIHPTHIQIEAIKKSGYKLVVVTKGFQQYSASFLVRADGGQKTLADLKGAKIGLPDEDSITAWMARATVRDVLGNANLVEYVYTRYQDAVPFFVENNLTKSGSTGSASVVRAWQAAGGKVLATSRAVPVKGILASPTMTADQVQKVREYLLSLDTSEEGKKKLEPTRYQGFAAYSDADMVAIGTWLGI